jgi:hypothetical protein
MKYRTAYRRLQSDDFAKNLKADKDVGRSEIWVELFTWWSGIIIVSADLSEAAYILFKSTQKNLEI